MEEPGVVLDKLLKHIESEVYSNCGLEISHIEVEQESKEYQACRFKLNELNIVCRKAKITPKKSGQFVTFWKRNGSGPIEPFSDTDKIDFYVVNIQTEKEIGQFVFPKSILIKKGILTTDKKEGKRAFRVYPSWDIVTSKQAKQSQKWQLSYFYEINEKTDFRKVKELFSGK